MKVSEFYKHLLKQHPNWFVTGKPPGHPEVLSYLWDFCGQTDRVDVYDSNGVKRVFITDIRQRWYHKVMNFLLLKKRLNMKAMMKYHKG